MATSGGIRVESGGFRLSTRNATNPLLLSLLCAGAAVALAPRGARRAALSADLDAMGIRPPSWARTAGAATAIAALASAVTIAIGIREHSGAVGASDAYGYVSQARMFADGSLRLAEPLIAQFPAFNPRAFAPLGWTPDPDRPALLPGYPPGLSLVMAAAMFVAGDAAAFLVVPLFAGLAVWATFVMGRALGGPTTGAAAALLLASSPAFLYQTTTWPMSDVPATACWAACLALVTRDGWPRALAAGIVAGLSILIRPNLAPLAVAPVLLLAWPAIRGGHWRPVLPRLAAFAPGVAAGAGAVAAFNTYWFGSPLSTGYGAALDPLYSWAFWWPNVRNFTQWLAETQSPAIALACAGPFLIGRPDPSSPSRAAMAAAGVAVVTIVTASYLFYFPFEPWWNLRFLLPAFPPLLAFLAVTISAIGRRSGGLAGMAAATALVVGLTAYGFSAARERSAFEQGAERRFIDTALHVKHRLPDSAVVLAVLHGGSVRMYAGRPTIRWDWLAPADLEPLLDALERRGFVPYLLLEGFEAEAFRERFTGASPLAELAAPVVARLPRHEVRIFRLRGAPPPGDADIIPGGAPLP